MGGALRGAFVAALLASSVASAKPAPTRAPSHIGAQARVAAKATGGEMRAAREVIGRREEPLTPEEDTAKQIEKLLRGPLRTATTGLFVADARTGEPLFSVNADDPLNPASNVKMISTATSLELLGPTFRYPTRLLGAPAQAGVVTGDVYLLGSYDPTLTATDLDDLAKQIAATGVTSITGNLVIGADATRDGLFRAMVPITVVGGASPKEAPVATAPFDFIQIKMEAKTLRGGRANLRYKVDDVDGKTIVTISGAIGKGFSTSYQAPTKQRTADAAFTLRAALRAHGVAIAGGVTTAELGDFLGAAVGTGALPVELGRHDSAPLADIVAHVNKWSINWLADRVVMTAAALARHEQPTMENALDAMYAWMARHAHIAKADLVVDTGSGLSYNTKITTKELVSIVRGAAGFAPEADQPLAKAWLDSLSIAGTDGTLSHRFLGAAVRGHIHGKTGTLSTSIALSGILDIDPNRPLAFSLVTNGTTPLSKAYVRKTHEQVVGLLVHYLATTAKAHPATVAPVVAPAPVQQRVPADLDEAEPNDALDGGDLAPPAAPPKRGAG